ncbi:MAG: trypsin-like peptidase domain-containing protein [Dehalococcoidia bacterium]|nr:trypsin-like peptidase domain-containing protein [Dehalococcoidia bacterium]
MASWSRRLGPLVLGALGALVALVAFTSWQRPPEPLTRTEVKSLVATAIATAEAQPARSAEVFRAILPSLVLIRTEGSRERAEAESIGSGVIVNADGTILTAHHVVDGARRIEVTFADGTTSAAQVIDATTNDLATLRPEQGPSLVVPAVLAGGPRVGDEAFAVGNPFGLSGSFTAGVISGLNRTIPVERGARRLTGLIQFDAAVNPGSSGGPLLNRDAQVVGIVTALANPSEDNAFLGIGFAVPFTGGGAGGGPPR